MSRIWGQLAGLAILLAGAGGVWWIFFGIPAQEQTAPPAIETVVPVKVGSVERRTLHGYVRAYGTVVPDPGTVEHTPASVAVTSPLESRVTEVFCRIGQQVEQGQLLFRLYDREARLAEEAARKYADIARKNMERQKELKALDSTSEKLLLEAQQQWEQAESQWEQSRIALALYQVSAAAAGTVLSVQVRPGQAVAHSEILATIVDLHRLLIRIAVTSEEIKYVHLGQSVEIMAPGETPGQDPATTGQVIYLDTQADPENDTVMVLVGFPPKAGLRNGEFVTTRILVAEHRDSLAVPVESVVTTPEGQKVVALVEGDEAVPTPVTTGLLEGSLIEVSGQGLEQNMTVVTSGAYGLPGRTKIRIMEQ